MFSVRSLGLPTLLVLSLAGHAGATPSTTYWAPSTASIQPFGVLHGTYDTYFGASEYPVDVGLTLGVLPLDKVQLEVGFDLFFPTADADGKALAFPIQLNAKIGTPEDALFKGSPGIGVGIYGLGFEKDVNNYDVLYGVIGKTFPVVGTLAVGGYYGLTKSLFLDKDMKEARAGLLASWTSQPIKLPVIDHILLCADVQTGNNVAGAGGGGIYIYFTPAIDILTGPVFFFEKEKAGGESWLWTVQLDVDIDFNPAKKE
jgi:hypothetical protein